VATDLRDPVAGERYPDGFNADCVWLVEAVSESIVYLVMVRGGERTQSFLEWPRTRWFAFVSRHGTSAAENQEAR
jgi:hypothetical protein